MYWDSVFNNLLSIPPGNLFSAILAAGMSFSGGSLSCSDPF
jgi:hypothetical protein